MVMETCRKMPSMIQFWRKKPKNSLREDQEENWKALFMRLLKMGSFYASEFTIIIFVASCFNLMHKIIHCYLL